MIKYNIFIYKSGESYYDYDWISDQFYNPNEHFGLTLSQALKLFNDNVADYKIILTNQISYDDMPVSSLYISSSEGKIDTFVVPDSYKRTILDEELDKL